jgi:virginiamycin B lyase
MTDPLPHLATNAALLHRRSAKPMTWRLFAAVAALFAPIALSAADLPDAVELDVPGSGDFLAADGDSVWITNRGRIERWSIAGLQASVAMPRPCGAPVVAFDALWVADCKEGAVFRIDRSRAEVTARIVTGVADPRGELSLAAGAGSVWVASDAAGQVSRIDPEKNQVTARIPVAAKAAALTFGFGSVWAANPGGSVQRVDPKLNRVVATIPTGRAPGFITAGLGGVWVQNQADGTVSRINPKRNAVIATIQVGKDLAYGDIATGGGRIWVRTTNDQLVVAIDPFTNRIVARYGKPKGSGAVRFGDGRLWVSAHDVRKLWAMKR